MSACEACFFKPLVSPQGRPLDALDVLCRYMKRTSGVDMIAKLLGYLVRLQILYAPSEAAKRAPKALLSSIVEGRMLANCLKATPTAKSALRCISRGVAGNKAALASQAPQLVHALTCMSLAFRSLEMYSSDFGYAAKRIWFALDGARLSHEYKRWKSLGLTCTAVLEALVLMRWHNHMRPHGARTADGSASIVGSPTTVLERTMSAVSYSTAPAGASVTNAAALVSGVVLTRALCDMYIYYRWLPSWNPRELPMYLAGLVSAVLGIWLIACDAITEAGLEVDAAAEKDQSRSNASSTAA